MSESSAPKRAIVAARSGLRIRVANGAGAPVGKKAEASDGALVWIYRERLPLSGRGDGNDAGWFLHGRFG